MTRFRFAGAALALGVVGAAQGCISRPVSKEEPTTKDSFQAALPQSGIDKVDLLVVVDNSSSMGDKQRILADALPDLLHGLVQPKCVDGVTGTPIGAVTDTTKPEGQQCPPGSEPAFTPVADMHIGVISTSLGSFGVSACAPNAEHHFDDEAHLLARGANGVVSAAGDLGFLAWYPDVDTNRDKQRHPEPPVPSIKTLHELETAFRDLVIGVGQDGCGIEAQLESAYRFLVQPDPGAVTIGATGTLTSGPVDGEILRQRAAFLRPDSLVAIVMLTDEDDDSVDPMSFRGSGWNFVQAPPMPRATAACESTPMASTCTSCAFAPNDPSCTANGGRYTAEEDDLNVRFHQMKRRFGVDPRFPVSRYIDGFTQPLVPHRGGEHDPNGGYVGKAGCTNPLFAASLPTGGNDDELCNLPRGPRTADSIYFALIGGVPSSFLPPSGDASATIDWTRILGRDPDKLDATGIDPHMIASMDPRAPLPGPDAPNDADPIIGREWTTKHKDLELACAFDLYERDANGTPKKVERACTGNCDCDGKSDIPLCKPGDPKIQIRGKAYPTLRELDVVRELGPRGIPASLCPVQLTSPDADDYGYRPAIRAILSRLERGVQACLPRKLERSDDAGNVPCLVVAILRDEGPDSDCSTFSLSSPPEDVEQQIRQRLTSEEGPAAARHPICEIPQIPVQPGTSCRSVESQIGFCYAERAPRALCTHSLQFTKPTEKLAGARLLLQCIQVSRPENAGADAPDR